MTDKEKKTDQFWAKHRDTIKAAEIHLAEACGSPGAPLKEKTKGHAGYVATLKALYISRAGKPVPPTWNNKPGADRGESKLLREVRAALRENEETRLPMTPQRLQKRLDEEAGNEEGNDDLAESGSDLAYEGTEDAERD